MTRATLIPFLSHAEPYWFGDNFSGASQGNVTKFVLHSTETPPPNCPGYAGGASAPTLTIDPWNLRGWQHFPANMSARALLNPTTTAVSENRDDVAQMEIIGYADPRNNPKYALANIPDSGLAFIAKVLRWYVDEGWGLPLRTTLEWPAFGTARLNQVRLSGPAYDAYTGVLGHMHVSGNDHVDPAGLNVARILQLANPAPSQEDDLPSVNDLLNAPIQRQGLANPLNDPKNLTSPAAVFAYFDAYQIRRDQEAAEIKALLNKILAALTKAP